MITLSSASFLPDRFDFEVLSAILSNIIGVISIIISIGLWKISNSTSKKIAENAAKLAISQSNDKQIATNIIIPEEHLKQIKRKIKILFKKGKRNSKNNPWVKAALIPILFKNYLSEENTVLLMKQWKHHGFIDWRGELEISTQVFLLKKDDLIENINPR